MYLFVVIVRPELEQKKPLRNPPYFRCHDFKRTLITEFSDKSSSYFGVISSNQHYLETYWTPEGFGRLGLDIHPSPAHHHNPLLAMFVALDPFRS
jgi:hypothetical protein